MMNLNSHTDRGGPHPGTEPLRIAVLSDTHGNYPLAVRILDRLPGMAGIIHLGDNIGDADTIELALSRPLTKIAGNCDPASEEARELLLSVNRSTLLLTHGDRYGVKSGIDRLYRRVAGENIGVVLYGHTHTPSILERDDILFVNPGSLGYKTLSPSIALLSITTQGVSAEIVPATGF